MIQLDFRSTCTKTTSSLAKTDVCPTPKLPEEAALNLICNWSYLTGMALLGSYTSTCERYFVKRPRLDELPMGAV